MEKSIKFTLFLFLSLMILTSTAAATSCNIPTKWDRYDNPVLRDKVRNENYEVASDPHVFLSEKTSTPYMIYSGDDKGEISIKLAKAKDLTTWKTEKTLLGLSQGHQKPKSKETPFYFKAPNGEHQIYFIGYADEETYKSQIFLATSEKVTGPYSIVPKPIVPRGKLSGRNVHTITSPSVLNHKGTLYLTFLAWNDFVNVSEVWVMGATSHDNGRTWGNIQEVDAPIGMEGQITQTPNGQFIAARTSEYKDTEAIFAACSSHPFGPYKNIKEPILFPNGSSWEADEIIAPQIFYNLESGTPILFYTGAEHKKGWWVLSATPLNANTN